MFCILYNKRDLFGPGYCTSICHMNAVIKPLVEATEETQEKKEEQSTPQDSQDTNDVKKHESKVQSGAIERQIKTGSELKMRIKKSWQSKIVHKGHLRMSVWLCFHFNKMHVINFAGKVLMYSG